MTSAVDTSGRPGVAALALALLLVCPGAFAAAPAPAAELAQSGQSGQLARPAAIPAALPTAHPNAHPAGHPAANPAAHSGAPSGAKATGPRTDPSGQAADSRVPHAVATPHPFDARRWASLVREPGPAVVVFTTTDCAYCPEAIEQVRRLTRGAKPAVRLDVVVMDGADQADTLGAEPPYNLADRLFVFDGQPVRVRRSVDPAWFGQTPYLAILAGDGAARFVSGTPTAADLRR